LGVSSPCFTGPGPEPIDDLSTERIGFREMKGGRMYTIGLDLAVQAAHKAVVADEQGGFITPVLTLRTRPRELDQLLVRARNGKPEIALRVVMEPTGMAWFPIAVYLVRHDVAVYLVNSQEVADLRRYYQRHAKSDRIDGVNGTRLSSSAK
jgi:transposase